VFATRERNVLDHLPERDRPLVKTRLRRAWASENHQQALDALQLLTGELERSHPGAASSLREGLEETLTLTRLGIRGKLKATLQSTNPIESVIGTVRQTSRNVKRWQTATCACAGPPQGCSRPRPRFRKIMGYSDLAKLTLAIEADLAAQHTPIHTASKEDARIPVTV
jgi:putative transposase